MLVEDEVFKLKVSKVVISYENQVFKRFFGVSFANYRTIYIIFSYWIIVLRNHRHLNLELVTLEVKLNRNQTKKISLKSERAKKSVHSTR